VTGLVHLGAGKVRDMDAAGDDDLLLVEAYERIAGLSCSDRPGA